MIIIYHLWMQGNLGSASWNASLFSFDMAKKTFKNDYIYKSDIYGVIYLIHDIKYVNIYLNPHA